MKFGVVTFPGSNCDGDTIHVLKNVLNQKVEHLWHKDSDLKGCDFIVLPGGFSYGDYLRSGAIARFSPIMAEIYKHAEKGGYVLGICNGFQVLTEARLLEGALLHNDVQKFVCKNIYLKPVSKSSAITKGLDRNKAYKVPIAHGEGRFYASNDTIKKLQDKDQILFNYVTEEGLVDETSNPNGSLLNIAGISNERGNVMGMMPHPERASEGILGNTDGRLLLRSIIENCNL
ncbi:MAG: phosphoribosylformylglycinamidine synthase subunit PurQ [Brumimicrobium sp.]|nr:phosphoribosylformylglycinamidine synthase subunit PurQ [Brumimicrobium sp.]